MTMAVVRHLLEVVVTERATRFESVRHVISVRPAHASGPRTTAHPAAARRASRSAIVSSFQGVVLV